MLKRLGLVEQDGSTGDLARRWRDDAQYSAVCAQIRSAIYPDELLDAVPDPAGDEPAAIRWFMNATGAGESAARYMARTYRLLSEADPSGAATATDRTRAASARASQPRKERSTTQETQRQSRPKPEPRTAERPNRDAEIQKPSAAQDARPSLHIDIQIHIAADASAEQIDQIFASMAKHLYSPNAG